MTDLMELPLGFFWEVAKRESAFMERERAAVEKAQAQARRKR